MQTYKVYFFNILYLSKGFMVGKRMTSLIESDEVKNITNLSIPIPIPPAGGMPYQVHRRSHNRFHRLHRYQVSFPLIGFQIFQVDRLDRLFCKAVSHFFTGQYKFQIFL